MNYVKTILYKEICQQPSILKEILNNARDLIFPVGKKLLGKFHSITIAARGSSDNAARYAQYLFGSQNRYPVSLATPSLFSLYKSPPDLHGSLIIGISQSGQSPDICSVLETGRSNGSPTLALTNQPNSPLAKICEYVIPLQAGFEYSVAATKSYTASLLCLALISLCFSEIECIPEYFQRIPFEVENLIKLVSGDLIIDTIAHENIKGVALGRGFNYATAFEIALKIKELTGLSIDSYSSADFRHGPISLIKQNDLAVIIGINGPSEQDISTMLNLLLKKSLKIISIGNLASFAKKSTVHFPISNDIPEWLSPIPAVVPGQIIAAKFGSALRLDIDHPFDLKKITQTL